MATILPFDNATINAVAVTKAEFVHGTGSLKKKGTDAATTTSDGRIHNHRKAVNRDASLEVYGDKTSLNSARGVGSTIVLKNNEETIDTFTGIISATYNSSSRTTNISIAGDPA